MGLDLLEVYSMKKVVRAWACFHPDGNIAIGTMGQFFIYNKPDDLENYFKYVEVEIKPILRKKTK